MSVTLLNANALHIPLAAESVQCVITSPPYWGLRDYGVDGQIGLEKTPADYVAHLVCIFRQVWRVLKDDGVVWLNLGDSYASTPSGGDGIKSSGLEGGKATQNHFRLATSKKNVPAGLKPKDLIGVPWMVAFALQSDGWYLRSDIIWSKPNPMPESVTDRPTKAHEYIFLLSKSERYYYNAEAIQERAAVGWNNSSFTDERDQLTKPGLGMKPRNGGGNYSKKYADAQPNHGGESNRVDTGYRNKRTVWTVATSPYSGAHFATFPPKLVEPMVLAGSAKGDLVLDPFAGTATVGRVAIKHQRRFVGLELNPEYIELARDRTSNVQVAML